MSENLSDNRETISSLTGEEPVSSDSGGSLVFNAITSIGKYSLLFLISISFLVLSGGLVLSQGSIGGVGDANDGDVLQASASELSSVGLLDVTKSPYNAKGDGVADDTSAIQAAINDAYAQQKVAFLPQGTYLVSNTLVGEQEDVQSAWRRKSPQLVGSTKGSRPIIKLKNNASGFGNGSSINTAKPVIHFWTPSQQAGASPGDDRSPNGFAKSIRNIVVEVGSGNPGAVGIQFTGAQENILHNVKIDLSKGGYAGLNHLVGTNSVTQDVEVIGGKYGIYISDARFPTLTNITLINQTEYAVYHAPNNQTLSLAGFKVVKNGAPAFYTNSRAWDASYNGGHLVLIDGEVNFSSTNGNAAIINDPDVGWTTNRMVTLNNVYFNNASTIIENGGKYANLAGGPGWKRVVEYGVPIDVSYGTSGHGLTIVDGNVRTTVYEKQVQSGSVPGTDLRSAHAVDMADFPTPDVILDAIASSSNKVGIIGGKTYVNVLDHGVSRASDSVTTNSIEGPNSGNTIQSLLDSYDVLFFPKGLYLTGRTLKLGANNHIMGLSNLLSEIRNHSSWNPAQSNQGSIISTVNSASAKSKLSLIKIGWSTTPSKDWFRGIHWQAGKNSQVFNVMFKPLYASEVGGNSHAEALISGNGGGRWFGAGFFGNGNRTHNAGHRKLKVENTTQPLVFYGLNVEDGHGDYQAEFDNVENVAVVGFKNENSNAVNFKNSQNIAIFGMTGSPGLTLVENEDVGIDGLVAKDFTNYGSSTISTASLLKETSGGNTLNITMQRAIASFRRGDPDFGAIFSSSSSSPAPVCGDGSCNGDETCSTCPGDCGSCPPPAECVLTGASWAKTTAVEGETVSLSVAGTNCDGQTVSFEVKEDDLLLDDPVGINPANATFSGGSAVSSWLAERQCDGVLCASGDPEYTFEGTLAGTGETIDSTNKLIVSASGGAPPPTSSSCQVAENVVSNCSFESGTSSWTKWADGSDDVVATFSTISGGTDGENHALYSFNSVGTNTQLYQHGMLLHANTEYTMRFDAYSSSGNDLQLFLQKHSADYDNYGLSKQINLTTGWGTYEITFTTSGFTGDTSDTRLRFWFSGFHSAGDVYHIDNIYLAPVGGTGGTGPICGDGSCNGDETCSACSVDCGACPVDPFCGDGSCNGDETCSTCPGDCGSCPPSGGTATCNFYVSNSGSDGNDGRSLGTAFKTIQKGLDSVSGTAANNTLCIDGGTYRPGDKLTLEKSGTTSAPITIVPYNNENVVIDGQYSVPGGAASTYGPNADICEEYWDDPTANEGPMPEHACWVYASLFTVRNSANVIIEDLELTRSRGRALMVQASDHVTLDNMLIRHNRLNGFFVDRDTDSSYVTLRNSDIYDNANFARYGRDPNQLNWPVNVSSSGSHITIENNKVHDNFGEGITFGEGEGNVARGNTVWNNISVNMYANRIINATFDRNFVFCTENVTTENKIGRANGIVFNNEFGSFQKYLAPTQNITVTNNIVVGCKQNLGFWAEDRMIGSKDVLVANNTFVNARATNIKNGINFQVMSVDTSQDGSSQHENIRIYNNVFYQDNLDTNEYGYSNVMANGANTAGFTYRNNIWNRPPAGLTGQTVVNPQLVNPVLVASGNSYTANDYKLSSASSPAVDAGTSLSEVVLDYFGGTRTGTLDVGAHEYGSSASGPVCGDGVCASTETCSSCSADCGSCPAPAECVLTGATWAKTTAVEGETVLLSVTGTDCNGQTVVFEVKEDDLLFDDPVGINPSSAVFSSGSAVSSWVTERQCDGALCLSGDPEYLFEATVAGTSNVIDSTNKLVVTEPEETTPPSTSPTCDVVDNTLENCSFESGTNNWTKWADGSDNTVATFSATSGGTDGSSHALYSFSSVGTNAQLYQQGMSIVADTEYVLKFDAYSSTGSDVEVYLQKHSAGYNNYGLSKQIDLSTGWSSYEMTFTTSGFSGTTTDARLRFWFGGLHSAGDVYHIDNVYLAPVGEVSSPPIDNFCGDGTCSSSESCESCSADCGTCVIPPTEFNVLLNPIEDAYVTSAWKNSNYGKKKTLQIRGASPHKLSYLKFDLGNLTTGELKSAVLRYKTYSSIWSSSSQSHEVHPVSDNSWGETTVTYNNRPVVDSTVLGTIPRVEREVWYEHDITDYVSQNIGGLMSLALVMDMNDGINIYSREETEFAPQLVVELSGTSSGTAPGLGSDDLYQGNILRDPSFELYASQPADQKDWVKWADVNDDSVASMGTDSPATHEDVSAKYEFHSVGSNVQLYQKDLELEPNTKYVLSFDAYSSSGNDLEVFVQKHGFPYSNYGLSNCRADLSTSWQSFNPSTLPCLEFTTTNFDTTVTDGRLRFWFKGMQAADDTYRIDNVLLKRADFCEDCEESLPPDPGDHAPGPGEDPSPYPVAEGCSNEGRNLSSVLFYEDWEDGRIPYGEPGADWKHVADYDGSILVALPEGPARCGNYSNSFPMVYGTTKDNSSALIVANELRLHHAPVTTFKYGQDYWLGYSVFLPADFEASVSQYNSIMGQMHAVPDQDLGEDWRNPILALHVGKEDGWRVSIKGDASEVTEKGTYDAAKWYNGPSLKLGEWTDIVIHTKFSYNSDGITQVWFDGEKVVDYKGPNAFNDAVGPYWKIGIYDWSWNTVVPDVKSKVAYFDEIRVGDQNATYEDVVPGGVPASGGSDSVDIQLQNNVEIESQVQDDVLLPQGVIFTTGFEDNPLNDFDTSGRSATFEWATDASYEGTHSLKTVVIDNRYDGSWLSSKNYIPAKENKNYKVTVWLRGQNIQKNAEVEMSFYGGYSALRYLNKHVTNVVASDLNSGWTKVELFGLSVEDTTYMRLIFKLNGSGTLWVDNIAVEELQ